MPQQTWKIKYKETSSFLKKDTTISLASKFFIPFYQLNISIIKLINLSNIYLEFNALEIVSWIFVLNIQENMV